MGEVVVKRGAVSDMSHGAVNVGVQMDECNGLEKLEHLQEHEDQRIYNKAVGIIDRHFGEGSWI